MAADKENQMSIINEKDIKRVLETIKVAYKEKEEEYKEKNIKIEDVTSLIENFSGKSINLVTIVISSIMLTMPLRNFIVLMEMVKTVEKIKYFKSIIKKDSKEKIKKNINNDIIN